MGLFGTGGAGGIGGGGGFPPNDLTSFTSQSTTSGITLNFSGPQPTYLEGSDNTPSFASAPRGIMIRYSKDRYPLKETDGTLAYDYKPDGDWNPTEKHSFEVIGLTKDVNYYFTAFPYSDYGVYNRSENDANRTECTWVGNTGTISVTVSAPEGYQGKLEPYTITLVDQASSSPQNISKEVNTGAGLTMFGGLMPGKSYIVRVSEIYGLRTPKDSGIITIVGGENKSVTMNYTKYILSECSWEEIDEISQAGNASNLFSLGDTKNIMVNGETITMEIIGFNHDDLTSGGKVGITFATKNLMASKRGVNNQTPQNTLNYEQTDIYEWLEGTIYNALPSDLKPVVKEVRKKCGTAPGSYSTTAVHNVDMKLFLLSLMELMGNNPSYGSSRWFAIEGQQYPVFPDDNSRIKKLNNGSGSASGYWTRTICMGGSYRNWQEISDDGKESSDSVTDITENLGVCFGFCV